MEKTIVESLQKSRILTLPAATASNYFPTSRRICRVLLLDTCSKIERGLVEERLNPSHFSSFSFPDHKLGDEARRPIVSGNNDEFDESQRNHDALVRQVGKSAAGHKTGAERSRATDKNGGGSDGQSPNRRRQDPPRQEQARGAEQEVVGHFRRLPSAAGDVDRLLQESGRAGQGGRRI